MTGGARGDAGAFLVRVVRLDPGALVRLRPAGAGLAALWARLPFDVLVTRLVAADRAGDATVGAAALLDALEKGHDALPPRQDTAWRGALPPGDGVPLDEIPAEALRTVAQAARETVRAAAARGVGERAVRDTLLDHVALTVEGAGARAEVPVRLVQGVARMGFLGVDPVAVRRAGAWVGLAATYGTAWYRPGGPILRPGAGPGPGAAR